MLFFLFVFFFRLTNLCSISHIYVNRKSVINFSAVHDAYLKNFEKLRLIRTGFIRISGYY